MSRTFALTYDYLCPFARIANETVIEAMDENPDWSVEFRPFSLSQNHTEEGSTPVWDRPVGSKGTRGTQALLWSLAIRDSFPESFRAFHQALFSARHDDAADVDADDVLAAAAASTGVDAAQVRSIVASGVPAKTLASEHAENVERWSVFGVPTFIQDDEAVFVRFMERHKAGDLIKVLDMLVWTNLNEFKRTVVEF
ncbi:MAG TPA: protein-disulfide isomerase [Actinobacteria bacterium]|nr:protein-disulfide isomerase [Actinomycetota bacterium]